MSEKKKLQYCGVSKFLDRYTRRKFGNDGKLIEEELRVLFLTHDTIVVSLWSDGQFVNSWNKNSNQLEQLLVFGNWVIDK